jgi:hypothetical protein
MLLFRIHAAPTWLITNAFTGAKLLPKSHPWRGKWFTLEDWHKCRTEVCWVFDTAFWISLIMIAVVLQSFRVELPLLPFEIQKGNRILQRETNRL